MAKSKKDDPEVSERFELFIAGFEIAYGFSELNSPIDKRKHFEIQTGDKEAHIMGHDYISALKSGPPPTAGESLGIDRLVRLL